MELVDEADLVAAQSRAVGFREFGAVATADRNAAAVGLSSSPVMCSSVDLPEPEGPTSATACPGHSVALAPFKTEISRVPCLKVRVTPSRTRIGSSRALCA